MNMKIVFQGIGIYEWRVYMKYYHLSPTEYCGMQLIIPVWDTCFWHQSNQLNPNEKNTAWGISNKFSLIPEVMALHRISDFTSNN